MADLIGDDRPPSRRLPVLAVAVLLLLGGCAVIRHVSAPATAPEAGALPSATATPTLPASRHSAIPSPYVSAYPASAEPTPVPRPWAGLPEGETQHVDYASSRWVRSGAASFLLGDGVRVITMERAVRGPVLLVQDRGSTELQQLRPDGSRLMLDAFPYDSRHPQGIAVDPDGRLVAYGLTSADPDGPFGLVVRDLGTGAVVASLRTELPFAVRDWTPGGVVLEVALDPGGPPYVWQPGGDAPALVTPQLPDGGPWLLAAAPDRALWAAAGAGCTGIVTRLGEPASQRFCRHELGRPAAWSPSTASVAARSGGGGVDVLDLRTGRTTPLAVPRRVFVRQVVWESEAVLLAVTTFDGDQGAVLRCRVGQSCQVLPLGPVGSRADLVLAD